MKLFESIVFAVLFQTESRWWGRNKAPAERDCAVLITVLVKGCSGETEPVTRENHTLRDS